MSQPDSFTKKLNRPYYLETSVNRRWISCFQYGIFVFLFLLIFQPFGLSSLPKGIVTVALGYGLTTFSVMALLNIVLLPLLPRFFSEQKWNVLSELYWNMLNVLIIGLANVFYSAFIGMVSLNLYTILIFEMYTITIAVFPIAITVFLKEANLKSKFEKRSEEINHVIEDHKEQKTGTESKEEYLMISIPSENEKDKLEIFLNDLLFIQSSDNYVEVHYVDKKETRKKLLRNSLKAISLYLENNKELFRCHKSYLVNLKKVKHVSGNAQGYKLHMERTDFLIPVSRQNNEELKNRLS